MMKFTKEQLIEWARERKSQAEDFPGVENAEKDLVLAEIALASLEAEPVADVVAWSSPNEERQCDIRWRRHDVAPSPLYTVPPAQDDYFSSLIAAARIRAHKAMLKFPQPNYVLNKVAEESGEVIKEVIHYTEGRGDWNKVEYELIDNLAMLIRLVTEGDQVIGFTPPDVCRGAKGSQPVSNGDELSSPVIPDGYALVPKEPTEAMILLLGLTGSFTAMDAAYQKMLAASPLHSATSTDI
ncbi:TPA: hypothetical protein ACNAEZ_000860 [Citrobacter farmeri]